MGQLTTQQGRPLIRSPSRGKKNDKQPHIGGRVFSLEGAEAENPTCVVTGTILVSNLYAHVLFDSGAIHSFVNPEFAKKLSDKPNEMDILLHVSTLLGSIYRTNVVFKNCTLNMEGRIIPAHLV